MTEKKPIKRLEKDLKNLSRGDRLIAHLRTEKGPSSWTFHEYISEPNDIIYIEVLKKDGRKKIKSSILKVYPGDFKGETIVDPFIKYEEIYKRGNKGYSRRLKTLTK